MLVYVKGVPGQKANVQVKRNGGTITAYTHAANYQPR